MTGILRPILLIRPHSHLHSPAPADRRSCFLYGSTCSQHRKKPRQSQIPDTDVPSSSRCYDGFQSLFLHNWKFRSGDSHAPQESSLFHDTSSGPHLHPEVEEVFPPAQLPSKAFHPPESDCMQRYAPEQVPRPPEATPSTDRCSGREGQK